MMDDFPNPRQTAIITNIQVPGEETSFPLTTDEAKLLYDELETHTFSKHHPMYHYHSGLLARMRSFIENNQDKLRICENSNSTRD